jgi:putative ABC transport system permease protein
VKIFRMALREMRRGQSKFIFFLLCIAIGVAALVGVKGFNANIQTALLREARTLMAADMQLSLNQPPSAEQLALINGLRTQGIQVVHNTETVSMAVNPANSETTLVEVKAVEPGYPFYGVLELNPSGKLTDESALVGPELLDKLGIKAGDSVKLGSATFTVAGVITKEPDRISAGFGAGPRFMITQGGLDRAKLIQLGSRARQVFLFKLASDAQVAPVRAQLTEAFAKERPRIADFREAQPQVKRFLDRMTTFLALVSMVALLVGGLGVANATRVFINQKLDAIATMKALGATNRKVATLYLTQMVILSLAGSLLGVLLGYGIVLLMPTVVGRFFSDLTLTITLSPAVALQGVTVGLLTAILFTLLPLTSIADVKPALVFRREMAENLPRAPWRQRLREGAILLLVGLGLALISAWIAGSLSWGFIFMGGLLAAVLILGGASWLAVRLVKAIKVPRKWFTVRQGLASLYRPGSQASAVVLALGIGVTVVLSIYLMQRSLLHEVNLTTPPGSPNMFFIGLQPKEVGPFKELLKANPAVASAPDPIPLVQGRLVKVNDMTKDQLTLTQEEERWFNFQFSTTFAESLPAGNQLIDGKWWTKADYMGHPLVSVEQMAAERLHLKPGSTVDMEMQGGQPLHATVFSIRKTTDFRAGGSFNFIFDPAAMESIPVSYLAQANIKPGQASAIQKDAVAQFPGLTSIDLHAVLEQVTQIMDRIGLVIRFVAGFSVIAGLIILASSVAATKFRRTREAVLYKTLGATRRRIWQIFAMEYAVLGLVAGLVGSVLSTAAVWSVMHYVMDITYQLEILPLVLAVGLSVVLTVVVGVLSTLDVLAAKPLQVLREE